ncbi:MAG: FprA family A-type flavoprotein [Deltaproteobacteria bacterium]|nr:FprA family A-type flavoprotein [Deltaproteobacteria bacterium]
MAKAIVIYATRTNETGKIAELIAEGLSSAGLDVTMGKVSEMEKKGIKPEEYDAIVLGSATYNGEMLQAMKTFLFTLEKMNLGKKVGGTFGAFGWSGEAPGRIFNTMKNVFKMKMADGPLKLKSASVKGGATMARDYGKQIAKKVG